MKSFSSNQESAISVTVILELVLRCIGINVMNCHLTRFYGFRAAGIHVKNLFFFIFLPLDQKDSFTTQIESAANYFFLSFDFPD